MTEQGLTYSQAGVDITKGNEAVEQVHLPSRSRD